MELCLPRPAASRRKSARFLAALVLLCATAAGAAAQEAADTQSAQIDSDVWHRATLTGDWGGIRTTLADHGITPSMTYTGDLQDIVQGGIHRGGVYDSLFQPQVDIDLNKLAGWQGATAHISMEGITGPSISASYAGNLTNTSSINGRPAIRLYNAWLQQDVGNGLLSVRAGLMNADAEFFVSQTASMFVDSAFGWPAILALDLPGGGPAYPLSSPGVRLKLQPTPNLALLAAMFSGDPTGQSGTNSLTTQQPSGTLISFTGGVLAMAEADWSLNQGKDAKGLPITLKVGGWYHSSRHFGDQRFDSSGLSLADPASNGMPRDHHGNWGLYGIADTKLFSGPCGKDTGLSAFARIAGAPDAQNLVSFYADGGLAYKGLIPLRPDDTAGLAVVYERISNRARSLDLDQRGLDGTIMPIRNQEVVLEISYQAQVTRWWTLQPDMQAIFNPGGRVANADGSVRQNALLLGLRTTVAF